MRFLPTGDGDTFTLVVPAEDASVKRVRIAVDETLRKWDLAALADDAILIASELSTNSIKAVTQARADVHSNYGVGLFPAAGMDIHLWLYVHQGVLFIGVWDACDDIPVMVSEAGMGECGRGIFLVDALAYEWGYEPAPQGGKIVWAALPIESAQHAGKGCRA